MSLRERNDCTLEALVPKASAIHSSDLPASTHSRICLMCGLRAMRFFESVMLPVPPYLPCLSRRNVWKRLIYELLTLPDNILLSERIFKASCLECSSHPLASPHRTLPTEAGRLAHRVPYAALGLSTC